MGMKKNKVHTTIDKGYAYTGAYTRRKKEGRVKLGTNEEDLKARIRSLKHGKDTKGFILFGYLEFYNTTKSQLEVIEAHTKTVMEKYLTHVGNDHFTFPINKKNKMLQYNIVCNCMLKIMMDEADRRGYKYTVHWVR